MIGKFRKDDSSHWYFIPESVLIKFDLLIEEISNEEEGSDKWYDLIGEFENRYGTYRCDSPTSYLIEIIKG